MFEQTNLQLLMLARNEGHYVFADSEYIYAGNEMFRIGIKNIYSDIKGSHFLPWIEIERLLMIEEIGESEGESIKLNTTQIPDDIDIDIDFVGNFKDMEYRDVTPIMRDFEIISLWEGRLKKYIRIVKICFSNGFDDLYFMLGHFHIMDLFRFGGASFNISEDGSVLRGILNGAVLYIKSLPVKLKDKKEE